MVVDEGPWATKSGGRGWARGHADALSVNPCVEGKTNSWSNRATYGLSHEGGVLARITFRGKSAHKHAGRIRWRDHRGHARGGNGISVWGQEKAGTPAAIAGSAAAGRGTCSRVGTNVRPKLRVPGDPPAQIRSRQVSTREDIVLVDSACRDLSGVHEV